MKALTCTHQSVGHTLAGASPAVVVRSSDALGESRRVGADVHTPERGTYARRGKPCRHDAVSDALGESRCEGADVHTPERGTSDSQNFKSPRSQGQALPSWRGLRTRYESKGAWRGL